LVAAFAPSGEADRDALVNLLTHARPQLRLKAVQLLAPATPDATAAVKWFKPRLSDDSAAVRREAVAAVGKWPAAAKECKKEVLDLLTDADPRVAAAAVDVAVAIGGQDVATALAKVINTETAPAEVKEPAVDAILKLELRD